MAESVVTQQQLQLLPEYQEKFIKDLLANLYRTEERQSVDAEGNLLFETDSETGEQVPVMESYAAGIGSMAPLYGTPREDEAGNPIYRRDAEGNLILDARGEPVQDVVGGIPAPDVIPLTDTQLAGIKLGTEGIGAYAPMLEESKQTYEKGVSALSTGFDPVTGQALAYDPTSYREFYDPFVEDVIDVTQQDIQRQANIERGRSAGQAVGQGAFGGSRAVVAEQEIQRAADDRAARTGAQLRSAAYTDALKGSQNAFENQLARGQSGAQVFQGLGTAQAGLGQFAQLLGGRDVKSLMDLGGIEQTQRQSEYDVQRQSGIEEMYEPFTRFESLANIFATATRGTPASSLTLGVAPEQNVLGSTVGTAMGLDSYQQMYGGSSGLGSKR